MAKFKSYASPTGFQPIQAPDESRKYLAQGQEALRAMQRAMQFDLANRDRYANAMQNAQQMEMQNREMIFKQDARNRAVIQDQINNNYQQTLRDAEVQGRQEIATLQALSTFSQTAFTALGEFNKKREEGIKLGVLNSIYNLGGDPSVAREIQKLDKNLTDQELQENQFIKNLLASGRGSIQDIRYLMKHSNAKYWSESKELLQRLGATTFPAYHADNYETKYQTPKGEMSLAEALANNDIESRETILTQIRLGFEKENLLGFNPHAAAEYTFPSMQAYENQIRQSSNARYRKSVDAEVSGNIIRTKRDIAFNEGGQALGRRIAEAPSGAQRRTELETTLTMFGAVANSDNADRGQVAWEDFLNTPILDNGKQTTIGEKHAENPRFVEVANAFKDARRRKIQDFNLEQSELLTQRNMAENDIIKMLEELPGGYTDADIEAAEARLDEIAPGMDSQRLNSMMKNESTNALYRNKITKQLQDLADRGLLTEERLNSMGIPGTIAAQFRGLAKATSEDRAANGNFKPQMEALAALAKSPPTIKAKPDGTYHWSVPLMTQQLQNRFLTKYSELKAAGDPNAVNAALSFVQQEFAAQSKNPQFFSTDSTNLGGYSQFARATTPSTASSARMQWVQGSVAKLGVKALDSNGSIFTISELNQIEKDMKKPGFKMDPMAEYIGRQMGVDPLTVINRQRIAAGLPPAQLPESTVTFSQTVNPQLKRMLDAYQTPSLSTRAMTSTRTFNPSLIPNGYGPMVVSASERAGVAPSYIAALAEIESSWNPNAGSAVGAIGLMQIYPPYHPQYTGGTDPQANLNYGAAYYGQLLKKYGDPIKAAGAYNSGPGRFDEYLDSGRPLPAETVNHMRKFSKALAKYGDPTQLQTGYTMRQSMQRLSRGSFERPSSVVFETASGQPGVDLFFESKRFPAVLGGVVKDVSRESGYGNYVVVESIDPMTNQKVDVLYAHLADGVRLRPGQQIQPGDIIGTQGGTGNVRSADGTIASIDFLAPAPRGSKSMTPYAGFDNLRRYVVSQLQR